MSIHDEDIAEWFEEAREFFEVEDQAAHLMELDRRKAVDIRVTCVLQKVAKTLLKNPFSMRQKAQPAGSLQLLPDTNQKAKGGNAW